MNRPPFKPGQKPPTADELNALAARRGLSSFRSLPMFVTLSGSANPYSWTENGGTRSGTAAYELNDKEDLDGRETMLYPAPAGWHYFRCKGSVETGTGFIRVLARNACTRAPLASASVVVKNNLGVTVATGTTNGVGLYTTPALPLGGSPYTVTVTSGSFPAGSSSVSLVTPGATVDTTVDITPGIASNVLVRVFACEALLAGATVTITGPNGYLATGLTDAFGEFTAVIPRTWEYRGEGTPDATYTRSVSHPLFATNTGTFPMGCGSNNLLFEIGALPKVDRYYSGDISLGTDCYDRPWPATMTATLDLTPYDPGYSVYSGVYEVDFVETPGLAQATYTRCYDVGDLYMSVSLFFNGTNTYCSSMPVLISLAWFGKLSDAPCEGFPVGQSLGILCEAFPPDACIDAFVATGVGGTVEN